MTPPSMGPAAGLYDAATGALRMHDLDATKAAKTFRERLLKDTALRSALELDYLNRVAADMRHTMKKVDSLLNARGKGSPGQAPVETQIGSAGARSSSRKKTEVSIHSRGKAGPHRKHGYGRGPTNAQKAAEIAVMQKTSLFDTWMVRGNRPIGDLHIYELRARALESVKTGFSFVIRGKDDIVDGIVEQLILNHVAGHTDDNARIRDAITVKTLEQFRVQGEELAKEGIETVNRIPRQLLARVAKGVEDTKQIEA